MRASIDDRDRHLDVQVRGPDVRGLDDRLRLLVFPDSDTSA